MKFICAFWAAIYLFAASANGQLLTGNQPSMQTIQSNLSAMPLSFAENRGQWDEKALFRAEAGGLLSGIAKMKWYINSHEIPTGLSKVVVLLPINQVL